ncbi:MAG: hypothetical protein P8170_15460 [Gemmatimonadota bacterium]
MTMSQMDQDTEYRIRESQASFARRVEDLERADRQARAARWLGPALGGVALIGVASLLIGGSDAYQLGTVAPSLETRELIVRDDIGVERAAVRVVDEGGRTNLTLSDGDGRIRVRVAVLPDGSPGVSLLDENGESRAILGLLADGTTSLVFANGDAVARAVLALTPDGATRIVFTDAAGDTRTAVGVDARGQPEVSTARVSGSEESSDSGSESGSESGSG